MNNQAYKNQVQLLLSTLPEVAKEKCFALHGGTAINLFIRDMPRLSVDIDLTYCLIEERQTSLQNINNALQRIKGRIETIFKDAKVFHKVETGKLLITRQRTEIKIEVNLVNRGVISDVHPVILCDKAQQRFNSFVAMTLVPIAQLYGGKICAALDRQHPRDLFDIKYLLKNEGLSQGIKEGFLFSLLCSDRPIHEMLNPHLLDQRQTELCRYLVYGERKSYE